jgi:hypothetical protein
VPVTARTPRRRLDTASIDWVRNRMRRRGKRSATSPAQGASRRNGRNCSPVTMPSAVADPLVRTVRTSQSWPTLPIHVPTLETKPPPNQSR